MRIKSKTGKFFQVVLWSFLLLALLGTRAYSGTNNLDLSGGVATGSAAFQGGQVKNIPSSSQANGIAVGGGSSLVIKSDGSIWGWGQDNYGQLGDGTNGNNFVTPMQGASGLSGVISVKMNGYYGAGIALKSDGTVWSWGSGAEYMLGNNSTASRNVPGAVLTVDSSPLSGVTAIASGLYTNLALKSDGTVWGWGNGQYGQFCDGLNSGRPVADQIPISNVVAVSAGRGYNMYLKSDGTVWSCGGNFSGQLGDGTTTHRSTPVQVSGLSGVTAIAAGDGNGLALKSDGTVWAWGYNGDGQLGNGTTINSYTPVQVTGLTGVEKIATGGNQPNSFRLALKSDGTVWTWGNNYYGTLGINNTTNKSTPQQVGSLSNIVVIAAGEWAEHSLALKSDGSVWAWGYNAYGQLGDGTTAQRNSPVQVAGLNLGSANGTYILNPFNVGSGKIVSLNITEAAGTPYYLFSTDGANWKKISGGSWTSSSLSVSTVGNTKTEVQALTAGKWSALLNGSSNLYIGLILPTGSSAVSGVTVNTATITSSLSGPTDISLTDYAGYTFVVTTDSGGPGSATIDIYYPANNSHLPGTVSAAGVTSANGFTTSTFNYGTFINDGIGKHTISISAQVVSDLYAGNSMDTTVHSQAPSITDFSCPPTLYAGQPGICSATVSPSYNVTNNWTIMGGTVTGQGSITAPQGAIVSETPGTATVTLTSCLTSDPTWCHQASANVQVLENLISTSFDTGVTTLVAGVPVTVQAQSAAVYGALVYNWSADNASLVNTAPTSPNTTAKSVTANSNSASVTITLTAALSSDANISKTITLTLPVVLPQLDVTLSGPVTVLIDTPVTYSVAANSNAGTPAFSLTLPDNSVVSGTSANYTFHQAGSYTISATVSLAEAPAVSVTKTLNVTAHYPSPTISNLSCPQSLAIGLTATCTASVSSFGNAAVANTWDIKNAGTLTTGGNVYDQAGTINPSATVVFTTPAGNKTITLTSCIVADPNTCGEASVTAMALTNDITLAFDDGVTSLEGGLPVTVQAQGSVLHGELTYTWNVDNATLTDAFPASPNTTARSVTANSNATSATLTLTATLTSYSSVSRTITLTLPVSQPQVTFPASSRITCDYMDIQAGGSLTCTAPEASVQGHSGLTYKWYVDDTEIPGATKPDNVVIRMPDNKVGNRSLKIEASLSALPNVKAGLAATILTRDISYTLTVKGYSQDFTVITASDGSKIYPVKPGSALTVILTPAGQFTPQVIVTLNGNTSNYTAAGKGQAVTLSVPTDGMKAFDEATVNITASSVEAATASKTYTLKIKQAPVLLSGITIATYQQNVVSDQNVVVSVNTPDGSQYNPDLHGSFYLQFYSGATLLGNSDTLYQPDKTYDLKINNTGRTSLKAKLAYTDSWASGKSYVSPDIYFYATSSSMPALTLTRKSSGTGYPPYSASMGLSMKGAVANVGSVTWQISKDNGDYADVTGGSKTGLTYTVTDPGSYSVRAIAIHSVDSSLTSTSSPVSFTVDETPEAITNVPFQVYRNSSSVLSLNFVTDKNASSLSALSLLTGETLDSGKSKWEIYDAGTGDLLFQDAFQSRYTKNVSDYLGRSIKVMAALKTKYGRSVTGEKILSLSDETTLSGAVPKVTVDSKKFSVTITCSTTDNCLNAVSSSFYKGEQIDGWTWTLYREVDGAETQVANSTGRSLSYAGPSGDYRVTVSMTTSQDRKVTGEMTYSVNWADYLTEAQKAPIEATISSAGGGKAYVGYNTRLTLSLKDSKQKANLGKVDWHIEPDGGDFSLLNSGPETVLTYKPDGAGTVSLKARTYNKYIDNAVYETPTITITVNAITDITSADMDIQRTDFKVLKFRISGISLATDLGEKVTKGTITAKDATSGDTVATANYATSGYLTSSHIINEALTITVEATTSLGRQINFTKLFDETFPDPYSSTTSIDTIPFEPTVTAYVYDLSKLQYAVRTTDINYYLVNKYGGSVRVYVQDSEVAVNPDAEGFLVQFQEAGDKTLTYKLLQSDGTVVGSKTFPLAVIAAEDILALNIGHVTLVSKTIDPVNRTVKVSARLPNEITELLSDRKLQAAGIEFGLVINAGQGIFTVAAPITLESKIYSYLDIKADAIGSYDVIFYITYRDRNYTSPKAVFQVQDVLSDLELFELEASQVTTNRLWGYANIKVAAQVAYKQAKQMSWKTEVQDSNGTVLVNYGQKTSISHRFTNPGWYKVKVTAFRQTDGSVYYTNEGDLQMVNQLPVLDSLDASVTINRKGDYILVARAAYSDPDSKTVKITWKICGQDYQKVTNRITYTIANLGACGDTYLQLDDGIGALVKYDVNVHELIVKANSLTQK